MIRIGIFVLALLQVLPAIAQEVPQAIPREILTSVDQPPEFPGGVAALKQYLYNNIRYPKKAYKNAVEGQVVVRLVIEVDG